MGMEVQLDGTTVPYLTVPYPSDQDVAGAKRAKGQQRFLIVYGSLVVECLGLRIRKVSH